MIKQNEMVDQDLLLVDTDNNTSPATSDLEQSHGYYLTMLKPLVYMIKTHQVGSHDSTLHPSTPDLEKSHGHHLIMLKQLVYMTKTHQAGSHDSILPPFTPDLG